MTSIPHRLYDQPWPEGEYRLFQIGFVVDDLLGTAARWARVFGIGPFHVLPPIEVPCTYRGTESGINVQVAVAQAGPVQIELVKQLCDRASVFRDLVAKGESGFHQLCTLTRDYERTKAYYEQLGYDAISELASPDGERVAYFDTVDDFGFFTEVAEWSASFVANLDRISRTCAEWDGSDPVRLLTRDGYRTP
jgi:glyoxalase/bleomycin resistance protein/dioxygenase superfamily protein